MCDLGLRLFCIFVGLAIVQMRHVIAVKCGCGSTSFERDVTAYDGIIMNDEHLYIDSFTGLNRVQCFLTCHRGRSSCTGILYNRVKTICKLLKLNLNETHKADKVTEYVWEYFRIIQGSRGCWCCEDGWTPYNYHCYRYNDTKLSWDDAKAVCEDQNSYLVQLETSEEIAWVLEAMLPEVELLDVYDNRTWVGATDRLVEGTFMWMVGYVGNLSRFWYPGQPDDSSSNQDCVTVMRSGYFDDATCDSEKVFVCEKQQQI